MNSVVDEPRVTGTNSYKKAKEELKIAKEKY